MAVCAPSPWLQFCEVRSKTHGRIRLGLSRLRVSDSRPVIEYWQTAQSAIFPALLTHGMLFTMLDSQRHRVRSLG